MIRYNKTIHATIFALISIGLLAHSGCQPAAPAAKNKNSSSDNETKVSETDPMAPEPTARKSTVGTEPVVISGDLASVDWDSMVGQEVKVTGNLVVVDTYDLIRRGQVKVARDRLYIPTNSVDPNDQDPSDASFEGGSNVANVTSAQKQNDKAVLILDDGSAKENIFPPALFPNLGDSNPTVRVGSVVNGVSGKLVKAGSNLLLVAKGPLQWTPAERPQRPDVGEADVTVASFNVLNYFTTLDDGKNNARGADSETELTRQEAKLVAAIIALQADVVGLMELENNLAAESRLVNALNQAMGKEVYQGCGLPGDFRQAPGGQDAIRVGIIYRNDRVDTVGDVSMIHNEAFGLARTPIVQEFKSKSADAPFTVVVNHFKSKGGSDRADAANKNKGDGQGAYNATRRDQALAICTYIDSRKQQDQRAQILVIGDLNAYGQEDPIDALRAKGLVDLREQFTEQIADVESDHYSFIYYGQSGSLDHAMATETLANRVSGVATWHINADEPRFLDYNQERNPKALYDVSPFRSSDHDPVLIGIQNE